MNQMTQAQKVATGTNIVRKQDKGTGDTLQVREVFFTIQGEGPFSGRRAVFVRMTGCHLSCFFCDTTWSDGEDKIYIFEKVVDKIEAAWDIARGNPFIVITGGEPLRQPLEPLINEIFGRWRDAIVQCETAGSFFQDCLTREGVYTVVSPKTAMVHEAIRQRACAWKYIIRAEDSRDPNDGLPTASTQREGETIRLARPPYTFPREDIYVSPCDEGNPTKNAANLATCVELVKRHGYRLNVQLHKLAGLP